MMKFGAKKEIIFLSSIVLLGSADLFTTVLGVAFFGAAEVNPLLSGLMQTSIPFFIGLKAAAVILSGFAFYAGAKTVAQSFNRSGMGIRFIEFGYFVSVIFLTIVVTNNVIVILRNA